MFKKIFNKLLNKKHKFILYGEPQVGQWKIIEPTGNERVIDYL